MHFILSLLRFERGSYRTLGSDNMRRRLREVGLAFVMVVLLHVMAMIFIERLSVGQALWLTMTTVTTVGYGDLHAQSSAGKFATALLLYCFGIFLLARIAALSFQLYIGRRNKMLKGYWRWNMENHIVIINTPDRGGESYFRRLMRQIRESPGLQDRSVLLLSEAFPDGLPDPLRELGMVHYHGSADRNEDLEAADVDVADHIIVLARNEFDRSSDGLTFDVLYRLKEKQVRATKLVECVNDDNRQRMKDMGADAIIRPAHSYPEMLVRSIVAPGTEQVLENLFTHRDSHTHRYDLEVRDVQWSDLVHALMDQGMGTALAYISTDGEIIANPPADTSVEAKGLIMLVREDADPDDRTFEKALEWLRS